MSPADLIFQAFSNLTGGLIDDLITVIIGMIVLGFMVKAFRMIQKVLLGKRLDNYIGDHDLGDDYLKYRDKQIIKAKYRHEYRDL